MTEKDDEERRTAGPRGEARRSRGEMGAGGGTTGVPAGDGADSPAGGVVVTDSGSGRAP